MPRHRYSCPGTLNQYTPLPSMAGPTTLFRGLPPTEMSATYQISSPTGPANPRPSPLPSSATRYSPPSRARTRGRSSATLPPWKPNFPWCDLSDAHPCRRHGHSGHRTAGRDPLHHASQCCDALCQAEALETHSDFLLSLFNDCRRDNASRCDRLPHGVAPLCGSSTPSLPAQGGQCLPQIFSIDRDLSDRACIGVKLQR
jgi:hypothetical protein